MAINEGYYLQVLIETKTKDFYEGFSKDKKMFGFSNHSAKSKYYDVLNKLVVGKIKDKTGGFAIKEFAGLKPTMYSFLVDDTSEHKKGYEKKCCSNNNSKWMQRRFVKNKCLRHSMNRIQSKNHIIGTYEINKISCFDYKIHIPNNGYDGLALG